MANYDIMLISDELKTRHIFNSREKFFMGKDKLNIGLFVSTLNDASVKTFCKGALSAAKDTGANLVIFPGMHLNADFNDTYHTPFFYQYNSIYKLADKKDFDLLIIMTGNIGNTLDNAEIQKFLDQYKGIPILSVYSEHDGCSSIMFDNKTGLSQAVNHLIHKHNCRKIGFVSGSRMNLDARERLETYFQTLIENNLPVDHNLVVYGNFTEFCEMEVDELINSNPDLDAICFANDEMAKGGYNVIAKSRYTIGKDISVVGFDNSKTAVNLYPTLTTVNAGSFELGYSSVKAASEVISAGEPIHMTVPTSLIIRNSCGCKNYSFDRLSYMFSDSKMTRDELACCTNEEYMAFLFGPENSPYYASYYNSSDYYDIKKYFIDFFDALGSPHESNFEEYRKNVLTCLQKIATTGIFEHIPFDAIHDVIDALYCKTTVTRGFNENVGFMFTQIYRELSVYQKMSDEKRIEDMNSKSSLINSMINDVIITDETNDQAFYPVMKSLASLGFSKSYMLLFDEPVFGNIHSGIKLPEQLFLRYAQEHDNIRYFKQPVPIRTDELFCNDHITDPEISYVISPIFSKEELYGIMIFDVVPSMYTYFSKITVQIGTALKYNLLLNKWQNLLDSEKENSKNFEKISKHDELTGVYNRRGYFDYAQSIINNPANTGKNAVVVFADLDNLKIINDQFGHDDGDYALKSIANILVKSFRTSDIIGRIGGDEFAILAILSNTENIGSITNRIKKTNVSFNETCDKPYFINTSVGVYPFTCAPSIELSSIMDHADELLYQQKKNKQKSILKSAT